jgi:hypothetical protein
MEVGMAANIQAVAKILKSSNLPQYLCIGGSWLAQA